MFTIVYLFQNILIIHKITLSYDSLRIVSDAKVIYLN